MPWSSVAPTTAKTMGPRSFDLVLVDDVVEQVFTGTRQHQAGHAINCYQNKAEQEHTPARMKQRPDFRQRLPVDLFLCFLGCGFDRCRSGCGSCGHKFP